MVSVAHVCEGKEWASSLGRRHKRLIQCRSCSSISHPHGRYHLEVNKLPLTTWFLAFYLVGQAKTGISSS